jgi:hypothetical protein
MRGFLGMLGFELLRKVYIGMMVACALEQQRQIFSPLHRHGQLLPGQIRPQA